MARTWRSKHYRPPPFGTNRIIPIPIKADDASCVTGNTTNTDPIPKKRKTADGNTTASVDSKEYDEPASKKTKTVDHNATASVDSKEYDEPASKKTKTVDHNGIANKTAVNKERPEIKNTTPSLGFGFATARTWRSKYYIPLPIKEDATANVSCVTGSTTNRDPIAKNRKTDHGNSTPSVDSKEYDERASKKRKTVDHKGIASINSKVYNEKGYDYNIYARDPNRELPNIYDVPLNEREHKVWLEFMKFDKDTPELFAIDERLVRQGRIPIEVDHPLVLIIRDFAVAAFNENWDMHVKKGDENHIHDFELMECYYVKVNKYYYFLMTIEAMEEGNLGVYEVHVNCRRFDGRLTLSKFILTNHTPIGGMKGKALSQLRSIYETAKGVEKDINIYLKTAHKSLKGKKKGITAADLICLKKHHFKAMYLCKSWRISQIYVKKKSKMIADLVRLKKQNNKAMKGLRRELSLHTQTLVPSSCSPTNRDDWNNPETYWYSGLLRRRSVAWGYDYKNPAGGPYRISMLY